MELEQLKEIWTSLDNRMQQQEGLRLTLIKEMLLSKSDKALSRLINYTYFGIILSLTGIPLLIWGYTISAQIMLRILIIPVIFFVLSCIVLGVVQLAKLHKVNFSNPIKVNIHVVERLNIFNKRSSVYGFIAGFLLFVALVVVVLLSSVNVEPWRWGFLAMVFLIGIFGGIWEYKRIYRRNFNSIIKSLDELKELEEPKNLQS